MSTELLTVEVDTDIKRKADAVFEELGMSVGEVLNMLLKYVANFRRLPRDLMKPPVPCLEDMTEEDFDAMIQESIDALKAGRVYSLEEARAIMEAEYGRI